MAFIQCWTCVGNGIISYPNMPIERCNDCGGTGCDVEKTKKLIPKHEQTFPAPLPKLSSEQS